MQSYCWAWRVRAGGVAPGQGTSGFLPQEAVNSGQQCHTGRGCSRDSLQSREAEHGHCCFTLLKTTPPAQSRDTAFVSKVKPIT